jgi:hypothetical protein
MEKRLYMKKEEDDLFVKETFDEKIRNHTSDIIFIVAMAIVTGVIIDSRKTNAAVIPNKTIKHQETLKNIQNRNTVLFNDSVKANIH